MDFAQAILGGAIGAITVIFLKARYEVARARKRQADQQVHVSLKMATEPSITENVVRDAA